MIAQNKTGAVRARATVRSGTCKVLGGAVGGEYGWVKETLS